MSSSVQGNGGLHAQKNLTPRRYTKPLLGPAYLSSHSADVILSDIRPIKLNAEALTCINVLLDEFLYNVLSTSQSLTPERLRTGLLGALPTTLGKEALLEAEVELRAYWDRNKGRKAAEDDKNSFDLHWSFEVRH